tara:strand:- start:830 stop:2779 length:1950 start_codon:yes stop_codon:yes gene_type:complete
MLLSLPLMSSADVNQPMPNVISSESIDCESEIVNAGQEINCNIDLSAMPGASSLRFEYLIDGGPNPVKASVLSVGTQHSCGILENGSAICWGSDPHGQLGDGGSSTKYVRPTNHITSPDGSPFHSIFAEYHRTCALTFEGHLYCWGYNPNGESGDGTTNTYKSPTTPVKIPLNRTVENIGMGRDHSCAVLDDSSLICWGSDSYGTLGNGDTETSSQYEPVHAAIPDGRIVKSVGGGRDNTCILLTDGGVMCWGRDNVGQNGDGGTSATTHSASSNVLLPDGRAAIHLEVGDFHSCVILDNGQVSCWGWNKHGMLGDNTTVDSNTPSIALLPNGSVAVDLDVGLYHSCAVIDNGSVYCWGHNNKGRLGVGAVNGAQFLIPQHVVGATDVVGVEVDEWHTCALNRNGTILCWGHNKQGQLGIGHSSDRNTPNELDWSSAPFSSPSGAAPTSIWIQDGLRGQMQKGESNVWNVSISLPEGTPIGMYGLEMNLMMIDGTRSTISMNNFVEVIGVDSDRDGVVDAEDAFPNDPNENSDRDGDGVGDNSDVFPDDSTETLDGDGDGVGDNIDAFPIDPTEWKDSDSDGVGDRADFYPYDASKSNSPSTLMILAPAGAILSLLFVVMFIRVWNRKGSGDNVSTPKFRGRKNPDRKF